jgi:hypothetical protein
MAWNIECNQEEKYITVVNVGPCSAQDVLDQVQELIKVTKENAIYDVLVDDTGMAMKLSISDIQHLPQVYKVLGVPKKGRVALIFAESTYRAGDFLFYERVAMSAGYTIKLFDDRKVALAWLKNKAE